MKKCLFPIILTLLSSNVHAENFPYDQAVKAGIKTCLPVIKKVTNFIIEDGNAGAHSLWDKENPNSGSFSTVIERDYSDGVLVSNITVTPAKNGKCSVEYQRIFNMDKPCIAVSQYFKNAKYRTELNKSVSVLEDGTTFMYLIPNGNQCTVIRKEYFVDGLKL